MEQIILAAGNFRDVERYFAELPGVISVRRGYSGGSTEDPTLDDVKSQTTGHAEVVLVEYDDAKISTESLLTKFFAMHDPTQLNRQGSDVGNEYRSAIFYVTDEQKEIAEKVMERAQKDTKETIATVVEQAGPFYRAE